MLHKIKQNLNLTSLNVLAILLLAVLIFVPELGFSSVESSLSEIQYKLTKVILPALSIIAICWAAFSVMSGNERGKTHLLYAIVGCLIAFGASSIVDFISQAVR